jgi:zinc transport system ATP-binding protein
MAEIIKVENLSLSYGQSEILHDISFKISKGDFVGLAGPNGAGKTSLVKALLNLIPISHGNIEFFGKKYTRFSDWSSIGYLPQKNSAINTLFPATVSEVVSLGLLAQKKWPRKITRQDMSRTDIALNDLDILHLKKKMLSELSGGQQQKVLLARALVSSPEILIFDEPSTALDPGSRESFFNFIQHLNTQHRITIILITHDTSYIGKYANKLLYLDKELVYFGDFSDFCRSEKMNAYFGKYEQHIICHQHNL